MSVVLNKRYINGLLFYGLRVLNTYCSIYYHLITYNSIQLKCKFIRQFCAETIVPTTPVLNLSQRLYDHL